jgi:hypothetical protein
MRIGKQDKGSAVSLVLRAAKLLGSFEVGYRYFPDDAVILPALMRKALIALGFKCCTLREGKTLHI